MLLGVNIDHVATLRNALLYFELCGEAEVSAGHGVVVYHFVCLVEHVVRQFLSFDTLFSLLAEFSDIFFNKLLHSSLFFAYLCIVSSRQASLRCSNARGFLFYMLWQKDIILRTILLRPIWQLSSRVEDYVQKTTGKPSTISRASDIISRQRHACQTPMALCGFPGDRYCSYGFPQELGV